MAIIHFTRFRKFLISLLDYGLIISETVKVATLIVLEACPYFKSKWVDIKIEKIIPANPEFQLTQYEQWRYIFQVEFKLKGGNMIIFPDPRLFGPEHFQLLEESRLQSIESLETGNSSTFSTFNLNSHQLLYCAHARVNHCLQSLVSYSDLKLEI